MNNLFETESILSYIAPPFHSILQILTFKLNNFVDVADKIPYFYHILVDKVTAR